MCDSIQERIGRIRCEGAGGVNIFVCGFVYEVNRLELIQDDADALV